MFHVFELAHHAQMSGHAFVLLDKRLFEIHDIFVGRFFGAVEVDGAEVLVLASFDEGELGEKGMGVGGLCNAHYIIQFPAQRITFQYRVYNTPARLQTA